MLEHRDAVLLARVQFAFTVSFHFVFPAFSIGLASYLMVLEALWLRTGRGVYANLFRYWLKVFAVVFGMGVLSGVVMSYQFGTNWSVFSEKAGPVIGPLMAYEVMTAFFLEAGFLGVMLFGMNKVGKGLHFLATCMVVLDTLISATWILAANSWMQTPAGHLLTEQGQFVPGPSWWAIVFTASFPYRLVHTVIAASLTTALAVGAVGAWHLLRGRANPGARKMFSMAMGMAAIVAPIQVLVGGAHGLNTLEHPPAKVLAIEGHYEPSPEGAPLILFGLPDRRPEAQAGLCRLAQEFRQGQGIRGPDRRARKGSRGKDRCLAGPGRLFQRRGPGRRHRRYRLEADRDPGERADAGGKGKVAADGKPPAPARHRPGPRHRGGLGRGAAGAGRIAARQPAHRHLPVPGPGWRRQGRVRQSLGRGHVPIRTISVLSQAGRISFSDPMPAKESQ